LPDSFSPGRAFNERGPDMSSLVFFIDEHAYAVFCWKNVSKPNVKIKNKTPKPSKGLKHHKNQRINILSSCGEKTDKNK